MSENEIKPVAWVTDDFITDKSSTTYDVETAERWRQKGWPVDGLYDQAAIDRLIEQRNNYRAAGDNFEFLANHRARELDRLTEERDAARYDAGTNSSVVVTLQQERLRLVAERDARSAESMRYRELIEYALAQHNGRNANHHSHWAAKAMNELAAIDAARAKEAQG